MLTEAQRKTFSREWLELIDDAEGLGLSVVWRRGFITNGFLYIVSEEQEIIVWPHGGMIKATWLTDTKSEDFDTTSDDEAISTIRRWLNEAECYKEDPAA
ncbi:hypothetical protein [Tumebacillus flagellatus]|uniref:Uncharacterized protein n=1 Tax=Tumebacillus flagellatus TaxID=1157490 RepID=A0A074LF51_9BACL|nr:hypothetical protein [Tumebacillus flagellatus]KEO80876.1 hypothetical protein EL26_23970 [Tumebacillus flagellatus]